MSNQPRDDEVESFLLKGMRMLKAGNGRMKRQEMTRSIWT
jgi:hypothetical protein